MWWVVKTTCAFRVGPNGWEERPAFPPESALAKISLYLRL
jgi:hypothetical protein